MKSGTVLKAPFPYFGGKRKVAALVWERFGRVDTYVEPFFGSGAVLLGRPLPFSGSETVNDKCGFIANAWRALKYDPNRTAEWADNPVNENDMHAIHAWLVRGGEDMQARLEGDPEWFDAKIAGRWLFGMACWIGSGFCSGDGPWRVVEVDGARQLVHLGNDGRGVNRQLVHLGNDGRGVNRKLVHLGNDGRGVNRKREELTTYFAALADRLRNVRVCCGDWSRVMGPSVTTVHGTAAVFLDPPYADTAKRAKGLYRKDCDQVAHDVRDWCIAHGDDPLYRIALCGYEGEHEMPASWDCVIGSAGMGHGFGGQAKDGYANAGRERIWFSPHCLNGAATPLFAGLESHDP